MLAKLIVAMLTTGIPVVAIAQGSVTVYGLVDAGVASEDIGAPGTRKSLLVGGTQGQSRIGFRGVEDLGGGLKALFNIESGIKLDTGEAGSTTAFWARRSIVGLEGSFGLVTLGREYTPVAQVAGATDPLGHGFYGTDLNAFDDTARDRVIRRASNTVNYKTPSFAGFFGRAVYGFGEQSVSPKLGDLIGLSVEYSKDALYAGAAYQQIERDVAGDDKQFIAGAGYNFGAYHLKANYISADPTGSANKFQQVNVGVSMGIGQGRLLTSVQWNKGENGAKATGFGATYSYNLSKRTNAFLSYGTLRNNELGRFGLYSATSKLTPSATQLGADPSGLVLGMQHRF